MTHETYLTENENGTWCLVNGNSESTESWAEYEDAKQAMITDNDLKQMATLKDNPDLYHDNSHINWID